MSYSYSSEKELEEQDDTFDGVIPVFSDSVDIRIGFINLPERAAKDASEFRVNLKYVSGWAQFKLIFTTFWWVFLLVFAVIGTCVGLCVMADQRSKEEYHEYHEDQEHLIVEHEAEEEHDD